MPPENDPPVNQSSTLALTVKLKWILASVIPLYLAFLGFYVSKDPIDASPLRDVTKSAIFAIFNKPEDRDKWLGHLPASESDISFKDRIRKIHTVARALQDKAGHKHKRTIQQAANDIIFLLDTTYAVIDCKYSKADLSKNLVCPLLKKTRFAEMDNEQLSKETHEILSGLDASLRSGNVITNSTSFLFDQIFELSLEEDNIIKNYRQHPRFLRQILNNVSNGETVSETEALNVSNPQLKACEPSKPEAWQNKFIDLLYEPVVKQRCRKVN